MVLEDVEAKVVVAEKEKVPFGVLMVGVLAAVAGVAAAKVVLEEQEVEVVAHLMRSTYLITELMGC
jgi:acyl-coenzyme A thioesterase PaaI-like protein